jgi:hypothetical protein
MEKTPGLVFAGPARGLLRVGKNCGSGCGIGLTCWTDGGVLSGSAETTADQCNQVLFTPPSYSHSIVLGGLLEMS